MEVILSRYCKSFTGKMSKRHGYAICQRGGRFFGQRNRKDVPADGHLRFIFDCAKLAQEGMLLANIRVPGEEMIEAAEEAGVCNDEMRSELSSLNETMAVDDVVQFRAKYGL